MRENLLVLITPDRLLTEKFKWNGSIRHIATAAGRR